MGRFDGYLMCVDFDGTLAEGAKIVPANVKAIQEFQAEGGRFTICTGRQPRFMLEQSFPITLNAPLICMNGTIIFDMEKGETLRYWTSGRRLWECCEELIDKYPGDITRINYYMQGGEEVTWYCGQSDVRQLYPLYDTPLYKVIVVVTTEASDRMLAQISAAQEGIFHVTRSWIHGIELQHPASGKGVAVNTVRRMLEGIHTVVCAGDYENDIPMLAVADISYAVGNATEAVKAAAERVTVPCHEGAIAAILHELATNR